MDHRGPRGATGSAARPQADRADTGSHRGDRRRRSPSMTRRRRVVRTPVAASACPRWAEPPSS